MSNLMSARELCVEALSVIGSYTINDDAPDEHHVARALTWLDLALAELGGQETRLWLVNQAVPIALTVDQASYNLPSSMGAGAPSSGFHFGIRATLSDGAGNRMPIKIVRREEFDNLSRPAASGLPQIIYIDRALDVTMQIYPVIATAGYSINLTFQEFATDVTKTRRSNIPHGLRVTWQLYMIYELASHLGAGVIRRLPQSELKEIKDTAEKRKMKLEAFDQNEFESDPICAPWGYC